MIQSLLVAFAMYSKIPVPAVEWNEKNMRYALCFFPWVGIVIGAVIYFVGNILIQTEVGKICFSIVMTLLPVILTGGIHMDGFLDTTDALHSYGDKEKKQKILKDPDCGAFAVIYCSVYLLLSVAIWSECTKKMLPFIAITYIISRTLSALSMASFPLAKNTGLVAVFQKGARKKTVQVVMVCYLAVEFLVLAIGNLVMAGGVLLAFVISFVYHYRLCSREFGGISGDLAGCFLQVSELLSLAAVCMVGRSGWM